MIVICGPCQLGRCKDCECKTRFCDCDHKGGIRIDTIDNPNSPPDSATTRQVLEIPEMDIPQT